MMLCDHRSVGILVRKGSLYLLIERRKPPFGFALPAGHVDNHGSFEEAARAELFEEVGLVAKQLVLLWQGRMNNPCRRPNGTWHYWIVYEAIEYFGDAALSQEEVKQLKWVDQSELEALAERTREAEYAKLLTAESWRLNPGLEPVWVEMLEKVGILRS